MVESTPSKALETLSQTLSNLLSQNQEPYVSFPSGIKLNHIKKELHHRITQLQSWKSELSQASPDPSSTETLSGISSLLSSYTQFLALQKFSQAILQQMQVINTTMLCLVRPSLISPEYKVFEKPRFSKSRFSTTSNESVLANIFSIYVESFTSIVSDIKLISNGQVLVLASYDKTIRIWSTTGKQLKILTGHQHYIEKITVSQDEKFLVSCSHDRKVIIWSLVTYEKIKELGQLQDTVFDVILTRDQKFLVSGDGGGIINVWLWKQFVECYEKNEAVEIEFYANLNQGNKVRCLESSKDGELVFAGGYRDGIKVWELETQTLKATLAGHKEIVLCMKLLSRSELLITTGQDCKVILWNINNYSMHASIDSNHKDFLSCILVSDDEKTAIVVGRDMFYSIVDLERMSAHKNGNLERGFVNAAIVKKSSEIILCEDNVTGIDTRTGEITFKICGNFVSKLIWLYASHYSKHCIGLSKDCIVKFWSLDDGEIKFSQKLSPNATSVYHTPNYKYLVYSINQTQTHILRISIF